MRNWGAIDLNDVRDEDIQDRDKAIIELWDVLERYFTMVNATRYPGTSQLVSGFFVFT